MMLRNFYICLILFVSCHTLALASDVKDMNWDGLEVVWLKDNRLPIYNVAFYFADGALSDGLSGETAFMFDQLKSGTNRYSHKEISDALDFYGVSTSYSVFHEYSLFRVTGLLKDVLPTMKMVCHLFHDSIFPVSELENQKKSDITGLANLVSSPDDLAERIFRRITMKGTPFADPADGTLKDIKRLKSAQLQGKLEYFKKRVVKRLYISGPDGLEVIRPIVTNECDFNIKSADFERKVSFKTPKSSKKGPWIHFINLPSSNQAQIRIGRVLEKNELVDEDLMKLTDSFMGGSSTSLFNEQIRVNRGLTYGIHVFLAPQKYYGRAGISTFTKDKSVSEVLNVIQELLQMAIKGGYAEEDVRRTQKFLAGNHLLRFENPASYLSQIIYYDHAGIDRNKMRNFPEIVEKYTKEDVAGSVARFFNWDNLHIVILGDKKIEAGLKKNGPVILHDYHSFL
jgi:zinc protease